MNRTQLRKLIVKILEENNLNSPSAVELLMLTAAAESELGHYIYQVGGGPALGIFQMEPTTELSLWEHFISRKPRLGGALLSYVAERPDSYHTNYSKDLEFNLGYQILIARIFYLQFPEPLPQSDDLVGLAAYWKKYWNTNQGAGTIEKAHRKYLRFAAAS